MAQTLKTMMRIYCFETKKDWDEGIHLLLFVARESVQESVGFSPFGIVFGHTVRRPFKLQLTEKLLWYVSDFHTKLFRVPSFASSVRSKHSLVAIKEQNLGKPSGSFNTNPLTKDLVISPILIVYSRRENVNSPRTFTKLGEVVAERTGFEYIKIPLIIRSSLYYKITSTLKLID